MRPPAIEKEELRWLLFVEKLTYEEIGQRVGLTASGVYQAARRYGLTRNKWVRRKWAIPWRVATDHSASPPAKYLRTLAAVAEGQPPHRFDVATAIRWARKLLDQGLDVDYDREAPPSDFSHRGGFYTKPADPENWHLKMVLERALREYPNLFPVE